MKLNPSKKLYYRDKFYKVVASRITREDTNSIYEHKCWDTAKYGRWNELKIRHNRSIDRVYFYVVQKEQAKAICSVLKSKVVEVVGPLNDYHHKILLGDKVKFLKCDVFDIKDNLYHKKYRYQVVYGLTEKKQTVDKITNIVYNNKEGFLGQGLYYSLGYTSPRVFVKGKKELMLLKLATEEHIQRVSTVITIQEIKDYGKKVNKNIC